MPQVNQLDPASVEAGSKAAQEALAGFAAALANAVDGEANTITALSPEAYAFGRAWAAKNLTSEAALWLESVFGFPHVSGAPAPETIGASTTLTAGLLNAQFVVDGHLRGFGHYARPEAEPTSPGAVPATAAPPEGVVDSTVSEEEQAPDPVMNATPNASVPPAKADEGPASI